MRVTSALPAYSRYDFITDVPVRILGGLIHNLLLFLTLVAFVGNLAFMIYATFPDFKWKYFSRL